MKTMDKLAHWAVIALWAVIFVTGFSIMFAIPMSICIGVVWFIYTFWQEILSIVVIAIVASLVLSAIDAWRFYNEE
jgi:membrane protein YdbS with pleckstrin-like domain